jgi:hypothetical protein
MKKFLLVSLGVALILNLLFGLNYFIRPLYSSVGRQRYGGIIDVGLSVNAVMYRWNGLLMTGFNFGNASDNFLLQFLLGWLVWWVIIVVVMLFVVGIGKLIRDKNLRK